MTRKRRKRGITPWKKTALKVCLLWLLIAGGLHLFRIWKATQFQDQREASRWGSAMSSAQVSAFLPETKALKEENIRELEYNINTALAQDSIKLTAEGKDAKLWQDCYSGIGEMTLTAGSKSVNVEAVGTGGAFFTFHPLNLSSGGYYLSDSLMKDEILLDEETAWKLFGSFDVTGRTVQVQDMFLRITGVYKKEEGRLYDQAGLADYLVFVQYKTLLQCGGGGSAGQGVPNTASIPSGAFPVPAQSALAAEETVDINIGDDGSGSDSDSQQETADSQESGSAEEAGGSGGSGSGSGSGDAASQNNSQTSEFVGNSNTAFKDTGMITNYEIVMPNPVEGYAAATVEKALGEDSGAIVVDNTNRYGERNLLKDLQEFALLGMRTQGVRYPYWENAAMGWETIFMVLFLLEAVLILLTVLLLVWMVIHWYRNKTWTVAGSIRNLQESVYEQQSRKKYPEYYKAKEQEESEEEELEEADPEEPAEDTSEETARSGPALLEDKGSIPFERIHGNRKAVEYETIHQDDQHDNGGNTGAVNDGMRRREQ